MQKKRSSFLGIRAKLTISIIFLLLGVTVFIDFTVYEIYKRDIEEKQLSSMEDANEILAENIKNLISGIEENLMSEIGRCDVFDYQAALSEASAASVERKLKGLATLMHFRNMECNSVFVLDAYTCRFFYDCTGSKSGIKEFQERKVYEEITRNQEKLLPARGSTVWRHYQDTPDEIYVIKSYVDPSDMQYKGIICLAVEVDFFESLLGEHDFASIIYDEQGNLLHCAKELRAKQLLDEEDKWNDYLVTETQINKRRGEWRLVGLIAKSEAFREMENLLRMLIIVEVVIFVIMIYVVYKISSGFLWNVTALAERFKQINRGEDILPIASHSHDETAYLCEQFDAMYSQLKENAEQMVKRDTLLKNAEYNALLAQMNPHFLYNSLESISATAKLSGQGDVVKAIQKLSNLMRVPLSGGNQEITLRQEIEHILDYLELQKIITGGRITWDIVCDNDIEDCLVPKLILQPIVENSIIHGLNDVLEDAIIVISAQKRNDSLLLEICDNGRGMERQVIDTLLKQEEDNRRDRIHIGIRSIQKRLHYLYGEEYGLEMWSEPDNGTVVRIHLPYRK